ncbi:MAG: sulfotransferase family protein [Alphaproteobacteria bacterium]|nr:sulfotransferase family protein [Alphaproteobacteria bacterium]
MSIHVPKCAGTSVRTLLEFWFGRGYFEHYADEKRDTPPVQHDLSSAGQIPICIHGHFNHRLKRGPDTYYPEVDQFITIIREPFDLHLSNYFYAKRLLGGGPLYRKGAPRDEAEFESLEAFLTKRKRSYLPGYFPPELTVDNCAEMLRERYLYVGIMEDISHSIGALATILGQANPRAAHSNIAPRDEDVPPGYREQFVELNPLAYAIYDFAKSTYRSVPAAPLDPLAKPARLPPSKRLLPRISRYLNKQ